MRQRANNGLKSILYWIQKLQKKSPLMALGGNIRGVSAIYPLDVYGTEGTKGVKPLKSLPIKHV